MDYNVKIDEFDGPLDLLLHLIKKSKLNIWDIKLEEIIDQYLDYINHLEKMNLNIASSYLVMASELIEIKSRMLLPLDESEEEEEINTKENLINRLIEYQKYKEITSEFENLKESREQIFTKSPERLVDYTENKPVIEGLSLDDLVMAFSKFLTRIELEKPTSTKITTIEISLDDVKKRIKNILPKGEKKNFLDLFEIKTKEYVVATFLALLEMSKEGDILIIQDHNFGNIYCEGV